MSGHRPRVILQRRYVRVGRVFVMRSLGGLSGWGRRPGVLATYFWIGRTAIGWEFRR